MPAERPPMPKGRLAAPREDTKAEIGETKAEIKLLRKDFARLYDALLKDRGKK